MYLSSGAVISAVKLLKEDVHPFVGITFLACKRYGLAVGTTQAVSLDSLTRQHLDKHHQIDRRSSHYFQPFRGNKWWVAAKYPSSGLQTVNTQTFPDVFLHTRKEKGWGFANDYVEQILKKLLQLNLPQRVRADALAAWLFKNDDLGSVDDFAQLTNLFFETYNITSEEREKLFTDPVLPSEEDADGAFVSEPLSMTMVAREFPAPPDAAVEGGRTIASMKLGNAGPSRDMQLDFGERLSLITGDNGLGKSFLLDFAWWAATGGWAERPVIPQIGSEGQGSFIEYSLRGMSDALSTFRATFNRATFTWTRQSGAMTMEALAVFSRADGSFAIADPFRSSGLAGGANTNSLTSYEVWNGRAGVIEGLVRDWTKWQASTDKKSLPLSNSGWVRRPDGLAF